MSSLPDEDEEQRLRSVLHQNAESILIARQRAERELQSAKESLELQSAELAASLALMQATLESTADGILATDEDGRITGFNTRFLAMWRMRRDDVDVGSHADVCAAMADQTVRPAQFAADTDAIRTGAPAESFDVIELTDGRVFERYTRSQRIGSVVIGRVWSYRDVTQRARGEEALRAAMAQAEAASRAKSAFLAMMSHELRTPLNAIAGYTELMQLGIHGAVTEQQQVVLSRIQASQRHLLGLIDEILTHAKLETGHAHFELTRVSAGDAIANAEALVAPQAWAKRITFASRPYPADAFMQADPEKVQQILLNLLSNAVKFTPPRGHVDIEREVVDGAVHIRVRDTGIGIPSDMHARIFEPFVQVRSELTRDVAGTGLGLAISLALARGMGGDLTVDSEPGIGSTFTLALPAA